MNKAQTATTNRIARRYALASGGERPDRLQGGGRNGDEMLVDIVTSATLAKAIARLAGESRRAYVAVTNKESLIDAVRMTKGTPIGVMDPRGEIVKECAALAFPGAMAPATVEGLASGEFVSAGGARRYTGGDRPPPRKPPEPDHAAPESSPRVFAVPDAAAFSETMPARFGRDGARRAIG